MLLLQSRGALQDGLSFVLGGSKEPESPKHKLALAAVQNQSNRQTEFETKKFGSTECGTANEDGESCNASQQCN